MTFDNCHAIMCQTQTPNVLNNVQEKAERVTNYIFAVFKGKKGSRRHGVRVPWYEIKHNEDAFCSVNLASVLHTNTIWVSVAKTNMGLGLKELHLRDSCESPTSPDFLSTLWKPFHKHQPQNTWPQVKFMFKWQDIEEKKKRVQRLFVYMGVKMVQNYSSKRLVLLIWLLICVARV